MCDISDALVIQAEQIAQASGVQLAIEKDYKYVRSLIKPNQYSISSNRIPIGVIPEGMVPISVTWRFFGPSIRIKYLR
jgi:hypothetical protein